MNIRQLKNEIASMLKSSNIEQNEAIIEAEMLIKAFFGFSDTEILLKEAESLDTVLTKEVLQMAALRASTRKPIQQILGFANFMGEKFLVDENVLIPRDETEILVISAADMIKRHDYKQILDIGAGSGCISCMLAKAADVKVLSVDISEKALEVAEKNAKNLRVDSNIKFLESDLFSNIKGEKFDLIVSNPPYIPKRMLEKAQEELKFEPQNALYTTDLEGVEFYDKIIKQSLKFLNVGGGIAFELGIGQSQTVHEMMLQSGFREIIIEKDLQGIDRVISGRL